MLWLPQDSGESSRWEVLMNCPQGGMRVCDGGQVRIVEVLILVYEESVPQRKKPLQLRHDG